MTKEILNYINNEIKDDELKNFRTNKLNIQKKKKNSRYPIWVSILDLKTMLKTQIIFIITTLKSYRVSI